MKLRSSALRSTPAQSPLARLALVALALSAIALSTWRIAQLFGSGQREQQLAAALEVRSFGKARVLLAEQIAARPHDPQLHFLAARLARRQNDLPQANQELQSCLTHGGDYQEIAFEQRLADLQRGEHTHVDEYDRFCVANPAAPETPLILEALIEGCLFTRNLRPLGGYLAAWEHRSKSTVDRSQALLWRGRALGLQRDLGGQKRAYQQAVELHPQNYAARLALAQLLLDHDLPAAAEQLAWLRAHSPESPEVGYYGAVLDRNLGRLENAVAELDGLLARQPKHVEALVLRGRIALEQQQVAAAKPYLAQAEQLAPLHPAVLSAMIDYLRLSGQPEECARYCQRVAEIKSETEQRRAAESQP